MAAIATVARKVIPTSMEFNFSTTMYLLMFQKTITKLGKIPAVNRQQQKNVTAEKIKYCHK